MLKMFQKKKSIAPDAIIDVRSFNGFKNHLVRYELHNIPLIDRYVSDRAALCGDNMWFSREEVKHDSPWLIDSKKSKVNPEDFCATCVSEYQKILDASH